MPRTTKARITETCLASVWRAQRDLPNDARKSVELLRGYSRASLGLLLGTSRDTLEMLKGIWLMIKTATRENQVKLTVSVPPSLHVLLRSWALCEGRELTSVVLQCVELSIRQLKSNGSIPSAAVRAYEGACVERLAVGGL